MSAMNTALAEEASEIAGTPIGPLLRSSLHRAMGTHLRQLLLDKEVSGYRGDLLVTDAWAEALGMRDSCAWARLA
jgi:hypothetical protein